MVLTNLKEFLVIKYNNILNWAEWKMATRSAFHGSQPVQNQPAFVISFHQL